MKKEIDVKTNKEVLDLCDGSLDEDVCVFVPVKTLRRMLEDIDFLTKDYKDKRS